MRQGTASSKTSELSFAVDHFENYNIEALCQVVVNLYEWRLPTNTKENIDLDVTPDGVPVAIVRLRDVGHLPEQIVVLYFQSCEHKRRTRKHDKYCLGWRPLHTYVYSTDGELQFEKDYRGQVIASTD